MEERRYYRVGGLDFSLSVNAETTPLLANYEPFVIPESQVTDVLFDLSLAPFEQPGETTHVFTDTSDDDMPRIEVYRVNDTNGWLFCVSQVKLSPVCLRILTDEHFRQATLHVPDERDTRFAIDNAAMLLYAFSSVSYGVLEMHASVTVRNGKGYLFLGHSGTGKSTHSRLWQQAFPDAWLLNDDNPVLRLLTDHTVRVYGSPWSGKTPCYKQADVPVGGIVQLRQAPQNTIRPLRLPEAYAFMLSSCSGLKIQPEMMDALYQTISQIIQTVPVYQLDCLPDTDAARLCHDTLNP